jgi:hypothetical protein
LQRRFPTFPTDIVWVGVDDVDVGLAESVEDWADATSRIAATNTAKTSILVVSQKPKTSLMSKKASGTFKKT